MPLSHLRVIDLTDLRGALAGRILADFGADVVKVEPPGGDPGRLRPPFIADVVAPDRSLPFLFRNTNKRGAVIDLRDDTGWRRFVDLCERADDWAWSSASAAGRGLGIVIAEWPIPRPPHWLDFVNDHEPLADLDFIRSQTASGEALGPVGFDGADRAILD